MDVKPCTDPTLSPEQLGEMEAIAQRIANKPDMPLSASSLLTEEVPTMAREIRRCWAAIGIYVAQADRLREQVQRLQTTSMKQEDRIKTLAEDCYLLRKRLQAAEAAHNQALGWERDRGIVARAKTTQLLLRVTELEEAHRYELGRANSLARQVAYLEARMPVGSTPFEEGVTT